MSRLLILILIGVIVGLLVGYVVFGKSGDNYIPVKTLISINDKNPESLQGALESVGRSIEELILDVKTVRRNILIFGLAGGLIGALLFAFSRRRRA